MIGSIGKFYFGVLYKKDQRNRAADGGEVESQEIFFPFTLHIL